MNGIRISALALSACLGCSSIEENLPDAAWDVTVTGTTTDCTDDLEGFQKSYEYQLYTDGSEVDLRLGEEDGGSVSFAIGVRSGCSRKQRFEHMPTTWLSFTVTRLNWSSAAAASLRSMDFSLDYF